MKTFIRILIFCTLLSLLSESSLASDVLSFSKNAYETITSLDTNQKEFSEEALKKFKEIFFYDGFNERAMSDIKKQASAEDYEKLKMAFQEVFFLNFKTSAIKLTQKKISHPQYAIKEEKPNFTVVSISGEASEGPLTIDFYIAKKNESDFGMIDLSVDGVQLSRNYRGSFNRIYRDKGVEGLLEKFKQKYQTLLDKNK